MTLLSDNNSVSQADCLRMKADGDLPQTLADAKIEYADITINDNNRCYCRFVGWSTIVSDADYYDDVCKEYLLEYAQAYLIWLGAGIIVIFTPISWWNISLPNCLNSRSTTLRVESKLLFYSRYLCLHSSIPRSLH